MIFPNKVVFIGMPASGKSYWASQLADLWHYRFFDLDTLIEQSSRQSITEIFEKKGERYFREIEKDGLKKWFDSDCQQSILASGGGTIILEENRKLLLSKSLVVYLKCSLTILEKRLNISTDSRPLLAENKSAQLTLLFAERQPFYKLAHLTIEADDLDLPTLEKHILSCINLQSF